MLQEKMKFTPVNRSPRGNPAISGTGTGPILKSIPPALPVSTKLGFRDRLGGLRVRWAIGRNDYRVESGLYSCGAPDRNSAVLVTANYKLTFDSVRKELTGLNLWLLVLDTDGVNVWCAAGKGTFGTDELVRRIAVSRLRQIVAHRELILPQLGAPGIAAHEVRSRSGFSVRYGPVYAKDLPAYLKTGKIKTDRMRRVTFTLRERLLVAPVEIAHAWPLVFVTVGIAALLSLPVAEGSLQRLVFSLVSLTGGIFAGTVLFPAFLPLLPFRAFSAKGALLGLAWSLGTLIAVFPLPQSLKNGADLLAEHLPAVFMTVPLVSFLAMNFTGASTFTCQKGTEVEVKTGIPLMIISVLAGSVLAAVNFFRLG
jgi:hypothetical protein